MGLTKIEKAMVVKELEEFVFKFHLSFKVSRSLGTLVST